ncbi:MAG: peptidoglycan DD-metalloendopeptidase family protein [Deltaproteobacteria bacterium]|nr:peptidoglycan DD-metalloendopeptidase family protein [Deltaproteobacteria bacterium]
MVKAARDFEAFFLGFVYERAYESIPKSELMGGGMADSMYHALFMQEVTAQGVKSGEGVGLAKMLMKQWDRHPGGFSPPQTPPGVLPTMPSGRGVVQFVPPVATPLEVTSPFGTRKDPITGRLEQHDGIDLAMAPGTPVRATAAGEVVYSGPRGGYGNVVVLQHPQGYETWYAHAQRTTVPVGKQVQAGEVVAFSGNTGRSTGPHLHFEVRKGGIPIDPKSYGTIDAKI